ncbi:DUF4386 domain-containing protein [Fulvivirga ulvae]|uniref:DUF4386 domain-containing protein n=1 Tax=Fulvivirga ulvae TaxID=2904245 RepID=UPI001F326024|nr:DUF4386 domain-containing protein [Fulvivirga ulvae]UII33586.1 DUF4386 domain-containing protein [Fulvivirga ulvae]
MGSEKLKTRFAGLFMIVGMAAGLFSVAPAIDSRHYLTEAAAHFNQVIIGAVFQFIMALSYLGVALLLYPIIRRFSGSLAIGFLSFRIIATNLVIFGTILLLLILALSNEFVSNSPENASNFQALGNALKITRDYINHVFMVLILCIGNFILYILLIRSKLIPLWLSVWGLVGTLLSAVASMLILFHIVEVITSEYLVLNMPTAVLELVLGMWLIVVGLNKKVLRAHRTKVNSRPERSYKSNRTHDKSTSVLK